MMGLEGDPHRNRFLASTAGRTARSLEWRLSVVSPVDDRQRRFAHAISARSLADASEQFEVPRIGSDARPSAGCSAAWRWARRRRSKHPRVRRQADPVQPDRVRGARITPVHIRPARVRQRPRRVDEQQGTVGRFAGHQPSHRQDLPPHWPIFVEPGLLFRIFVGTIVVVWVDRRVLVRAFFVLAIGATGVSCAPASRPTPATPSADTVPLAITIDDLPFVGPTTGNEPPAQVVERMVRTLLDRGIPATGFVVCRRAEDQPNAWQRWIGAGLALGNHSYTHRALDDVDVSEWLTDVERCQVKLTNDIGSTPKWFRYPYLRTGADAPRRAAGEKGLAALSLRRAPVTVDTADWAFANTYAHAKTTDSDRAEQIAAAYIEHLRGSWRHYRRVAQTRTGREIAQVILLHANAILADQLPRLLDMLQAEGAHFVSLDEAMTDPVYRATDDWLDPVGASWLYRLAPADIAAWGWDRGQLAAIQARFEDRPEERFGRIGRSTRVRRLDGSPAWVIRHDKPVAANALVYRTKDGTPVLVDTPWTDEATREVVDWAAVRFGRPLALAIVGHFHADSAGGIGALRADGIVTIGSSHTAHLIETRGAFLQKTLIETYGPAFAGPPPVPPAQTFDPEVGYETEVGGTKIRIFYPGAAHAPDNVVTFFEESGLLFGGCMIKAGDSLGYLGDADLASWPAAVRRLIALSPQLVIPGHGDRFGPDLLPHTLDLLDQHRARETQ